MKRSVPVLHNSTDKVLATIKEKIETFRIAYSTTYRSNRFFPLLVEIVDNFHFNPGKR